MFHRHILIVLHICAYNEVGCCIL